MGLAEHVVILVMRRCDFQTACTEINLDIAVFYDRNHTAHQRHDHLLALEPGVLGILGVDTHRSVPHDGLGAGGGHHCILAAILVDMHDIAPLLAHSVGGLPIRQIITEVIKL